MIGGEVERGEVGGLPNQACDLHVSLSYQKKQYGSSITIIIVDFGKSLLLPLMLVLMFMVTNIHFGCGRCSMLAQLFSGAS